MRHFRFVVNFLFLLSAVCASAQEQTVDILERVRSSVVQINIHIKSEGLVDSASLPVPPAVQQCFHGKTCIMGTGILINETGDVITASHVASAVKDIVETLRAHGLNAQVKVGMTKKGIDKQSEGIGTSSVYIGSFSFSLDANIVAIDPLHDLALIHMLQQPVVMPLVEIDGKVERTTPGMPPPVKFAIEHTRDAEPVFACGFPLGEPALTTTTGTIATAWANENVLTAQKAGNRGTINVYRADLRATFGNSGGPVFRLSDQAVLGILIEINTGPGGLATVVPSKYVTELLTKQGTHWDQAPVKK